MLLWPTPTAFPDLCIQRHVGRRFVEKGDAQVAKSDSRRRSVQGPVAFTLPNRAG